VTAQRRLSIDIETFSKIDLKKSGLYKYVQDPSFEILLIAYAWEDGDVQLIDLTTDAARAPGNTALYQFTMALADPNVIKHAYNAQFEIVCLNKFWPSPVHQWRCTQVHGLYCGYPGGLHAISSALSLPDDKKKMWEGNKLIRLFCVPQAPAPENGYRTRIKASHEPAKWTLFKAYCKQDVVAEMAVEKRLAAWPLPDEEQKLWTLDLELNARGALVNTEFVESAMTLSNAVSLELAQKAKDLTQLDNPNSRNQIKAWLEQELGAPVADVTKKTVRELLNATDNDLVRQFLKTRQEMAKSSVSKYAAAQNSAGEDHRIRGLVQFYGAGRTGRWAGRLVQIHNLPQNHLPTLDLARDLVNRRQLASLKLLYGNVPDTLSQLIRTAFISNTGRLIVADFSAIEARVIAWLAGEQWRNEVFATHGKIYEASASAMFKTPIEKIVKGNPEYALRQKGKIAELALGYGGAGGALTSMGALDMGLSEDELPELVTLWRNSNPCIVKLWKDLEQAAITTESTAQDVTVKNIRFRKETDGRLTFLTVQLPVGRKLFYAQPETRPSKMFNNLTLHYKEAVGSTFALQDTFGGKLTENVVQAISRDCLALAIQRLHAAGFRIVFHVHDEVVMEAEPGQTAEQACEIMSQPIPWAPGLILKAAGFDCEYYQKE
jgi:DNA polymerase